MGWVYFIGACSDGEECWVKVGFTAGSVQARRASLQTGCPFSLDVLAYAPGTIEDEQRLHARFDAFRGYGEWFQMEGFFQAYVHSLMGDGPLKPAPTLWTEVWHREHIA